MTGTPMGLQCGLLPLGVLRQTFTSVMIFVAFGSIGIIGGFVYYKLLLWSSLGLLCLLGTEVLVLQ